MEQEVIYFNVKSKKELSPIDRYLVKHFPDKYKIKTKKKTKNTDKLIDDINKRKQKKLEKQTKDIFKEYDKMMKNPKKYKDGISKKEKQILKFFKMKEKETVKYKKKSKAYKMQQKENKMKKNILYYNAINELQERFDSLNDDSHIRKKNPNKQYMKAIDNTTSSRKVALLKTLDEEILAHLMSDPLAISNDNLAVKYKEYDNDIKKKKKKPISIDRLII